MKKRIINKKITDQTGKSISRKTIHQYKNGKYPGNIKRLEEIMNKYAGKKPHKSGIKKRFWQWVAKNIQKELQIVESTERTNSLAEEMAKAILEEMERYTSV